VNFSTEFGVKKKSCIFFHKNLALALLLEKKALLLLPKFRTIFFVTWFIARITLIPRRKGEDSFFWQGFCLV
jgi:hypothetical protein